MAKTAKEIAKNILADPNYYQLPFSSERGSKKKLRAILADLHLDMETLLSSLSKEYRTDDLDKKLLALKELSTSKTLNENRVRFWLNMMCSDLKSLSEKVLSES